MFVHGEKRGYVGLGQHGMNEIVIVMPATGIGHLDRKVYVRQGLCDLAIHQTVDRGFWTALPSRCVQENELRFIGGIDTQYLIARGLGFARCDADLLPENSIQERGFAHIGSADNRNKTTAWAHDRQLSRSCRAARAAACSALRLVRPMAVTGSLNASEKQDTVNVWSWDGPDTPVVS